MKKSNLLYLFTLIFSFSVFTGCKDDERNNTEEPIGEIAGTYLGTLDIKLDGASLEPIEERVYISQDNKMTAKLELKNFSLTVAGNMLKVGDITISDIPLSSASSIVTLKETVVTMNHPALGQLNLKATGTVEDSKANLHIIVDAVKQQKSIDINFSGIKTDKETDNVDYAENLAAWYKRESLTITGDTIDSKHPNEGISVIYQGKNIVAIESFNLSFPSNASGAAATRLIPQIDSIPLIKASNSVMIDSIRIAIPPRYKQDTAYMVLSGFIQKEILTLKMKVSTKNKKANYIYVGIKKKTGATISQMTLTGDAVTIQPELSTEKDKNGNYNIMFYVKEGTTDAQLKMVPTFTLTDGATITQNGAMYIPDTPVDFSKEQKFIVKAESGKTSQTYLVKHEVLKTDFDFSSDFETWETLNASTDTTLVYQMYDEPINGWATSNEMIKTIKLFETLYDKFKPYVVTQSTDSRSGSKAARLETVFTTGGMYSEFMVVPAIVSGTVFTGVFKVDMTSLKNAQYGYPCFKSPVAFKGSYKYAPGNDYYLCSNLQKPHEVAIDKTKTDTPAMNAVLYEVDSYAFSTLDETNLLTSDKIVATASVDGKAQASYTDFNVAFKFRENKTFDPAKRYKLAIVCSSSKDGNKFSGAPGSVLFVDNLEVTF